MLPLSLDGARSLQRHMGVGLQLSGIQNNPAFQKEPLPGALNERVVVATDRIETGGPILESPVNGETRRTGGVVFINFNSDIGYRMEALRRVNDIVGQ